MKAIIISGMPAVGKTTVSRQVADALKKPMVGGGDVLKEMAVEEGYTPGGEDWWDKGEGMKFLEARKRSSGFDKEVDARLLQGEEGGCRDHKLPCPVAHEGRAQGVALRQRQ
jgi:cytidylate kinase